MGLCTGLLPAAALAVTKSTSQLLEQAPDIVRMALRLGFVVRRRSTQVEKSRESWATIVSGISPQEQQRFLDAFHKENVRVSQTRESMTATDESSVNSHD